MAEPLLRMEQIAKRFGTTVALADVSLEVGRGEVHALVGENGAGKSTLMKILAGAEKSDAGSVWFDGQPFSPRGPLDAIHAGIAIVYQEFNLAPHLSVQANLLLGRERTVAGFLESELHGGQDRELSRRTLDRLGLAIPLQKRVSGLGVADQQMVEIARALLGGARLVVMDEPTSALASHEVERLFQIIGQLRAEGISVIYISHFLEEIERIADRLTVLRDGHTVGMGSVRDWPRGRIVESMVGRKVVEMYPRTPHAIGTPLLRVKHLAGAERPREASLVLHRGESVLGIAGLVGAGRTEMFRALFGLDPHRSGEAELNGVRIQRFAPSEWVGCGVSLLSEDRKTEGLAQNLSCVANISLPTLGRVARMGWIRHGTESNSALQIARRLGIRWSSPQQKVSGLSGGNQQKVAVGRLLFAEADVLLLDEPTRGIDVAAKVDLYNAIGSLAAAGKGIIVVSSYLPELLGICNRIAVMSRGVLSAAYDVKDLTAEKVMQLAVGE